MAARNSTSLQVPAVSLLLSFLALVRKYESRWFVDLVICLNLMLNFNTGIRETK